MKKAHIRIPMTFDANGAPVPAHEVVRFVCLKSHPHPTSAGAEACELALANGASDAQLLALFDAEVEAFNAE